MASSKVVWSNTAIKQRRAIFEYWNKNNGSTKYSNRIRLLVNKRIDLIKSQPHLFLKTDLQDTHVTVIENFKLFYRIYPDLIMVTAFWDSRQDPEKLLELLGK